MKMRALTISELNGYLSKVVKADSAGVFSCTGKGDDTSKYIAFCGFDGI